MTCNVSFLVVLSCIQIQQDLLTHTHASGSIFHVFLNSISEMEHALLYSVGVNLPAHRAGQLDRVLVLASPINDINLHAWDLNRVKRFIELDIGIRMELCPSCVRGQLTTLTFVIEKLFVKDCMSFLRKEARISRPPFDDHGLLIHTVSHQCFFTTPPAESAPPPPYSKSSTLPSDQGNGRRKHQISTHETVQLKRPMTTQRKQPAVMEIRTHSKSSPLPIRSALPLSDAMWEDSFSTGSESHMNEAHFSQKSTDSYKADLPPRTIPRPNYESGIPAEAQPYLNYQPHLYSASGNRRFEPPYQVSSRIIITDSGEVQFERNVMGAMPTSSQTRFAFNHQTPLPPRGLRASSSHQNTLRTEVTMQTTHQYPSVSNSNDVDSNDYVNVVKTVSNEELSDTRRYVNFPSSTTPPPTRRYHGKTTHLLSRTNSDSELNYTTFETKSQTNSRKRNVKRASEVSQTSDIYIIATSPFPGHSSPISEQVLPVDIAESHPVESATDSMVILPQRGENEGTNGNENGTSSVVCELTDKCSIHNSHAVEGNGKMKPQDKKNPSSVSNENEKPQSPVPIPRKKPTVSPRRKTVLRSKSSDSDQCLRDETQPEPQKRPVPRPRAKTSVHVSVNVNYSVANETSSTASTDAYDQDVSSPHTYDESGIRISDV